MRQSCGELDYAGQTPLVDTLLFITASCRAIYYGLVPSPGGYPAIYYGLVTSCSVTVAFYECAMGRKVAALDNFIL